METITVTADQLDDLSPQQLAACFRAEIRAHCEDIAALDGTDPRRIERAIVAWHAPLDDCDDMDVLQQLLFECMTILGGLRAGMSWQMTLWAVAKAVAVADRHSERPINSAALAYLPYDGSTNPDPVEAAKIRGSALGLYWRDER